MPLEEQQQFQRQLGPPSSKNTYSTQATKDPGHTATRESNPRKELKGNASVHKQIS